MSWSATAESVPKDPGAARPMLKDVLDSAPKMLDGEGNEMVAAEVAEQKAAALEAALTLLAACGTGPCSVTFSGHANEGHGKTPGWANEAISVRVNEN